MQTTDLTAEKKNVVTEHEQPKFILICVECTDEIVRSYYPNSQFEQMCEGCLKFYNK
jgi:hypothetical protein